MFADETLTAGQKFPAFGSQFPVPFEVVWVCPVRPVFKIREAGPDYTQIERVVRFSVFLHAARVWKLHLTPGKGIGRVA